MKIEQIKLLRGCHDDTATTGQGCFMDVAAYLNGDSVITDYSESVCVVARGMLIFLNDLATNNQRKKLLPFLLRAIQSATHHGPTIISRLDLLIDFGHAQNAIFDDMKKNKVTGNFAREGASCAFGFFYDGLQYRKILHPVFPCKFHAAMAAGRVMEASVHFWLFFKPFCKHKKITFDSGLKLLDAMLPPADEPPPIVRERIDRLVTLNRSAALID